MIAVNTVPFALVVWVICFAINSLQLVLLPLNLALPENIIHF